MLTRGVEFNTFVSAWASAAALRRSVRVRSVNETQPYTNDSRLENWIRLLTTNVCST